MAPPHLGDGLADARKHARKELAVLRRLDGRDGRAEHRAPERREVPGAVQREAYVERRLAAHGDEDAVGPLLAEHLEHEVVRDGQEVHAVGHALGRLRQQQGAGHVRSVAGDLPPALPTWTVAMLGLMSTTSTPSSLSALMAWLPL